MQQLCGGMVQTVCRGVVLDVVFVGKADEGTFKRLHPHIHNQYSDGQVQRWAGSNSEGSVLAFFNEIRA